MTEATNGLLRVEGLTVDFDGGKPTAHRALDGVSLSVHEGEVVGLVGESGSGKTVLAHSILGLLPGNGHATSGHIIWRGCELHGLCEQKLRSIRGKEIAMIFQDPQASLNPVYTVGRQLLWRLKLHRSLSGQTAAAEAHRLLEAVQLLDSDRVFGCYAHELSGGMAQRVMIAMAIAGQPKLLIADEPTSALDATIQLEIVALLKALQLKHSMAVLFITHNMNLLSGFCSAITVMRCGQIVEQAPTCSILAEPKTDYTKRLLLASGVCHQVASPKESFFGKESETSLETITSSH